LKILVVEDEKNIADVVLKYLDKSGFICSLAENGFQALDMLSQQEYNLVILDVMMPGIDGFEVLKSIRVSSDIPVIMLTAKKEEVDRLKGFEHGVDDYVVKPFSPRELVSRVKVFLKRTYAYSEEEVYQVGQLKLYCGSKRLEKNGQGIAVTGLEYKLLYAFMRHRGQILSRDQLIDLCFGMDYDGYDRNIDTYIKRLRQKIETNVKKPEYLITHYGLGYCFGGKINDHS